MDKLNMHKISIKQREGSEDKVMTGATTEVLLDGEPLRGISKISFESEAKSVAKVKIEMYASVDIYGNFILGEVEPLRTKDFEKLQDKVKETIDECKKR